MTMQAAAQQSPTEISIEQALAFHRQGRLADADRIYGVMLAAHPESFDALHLSGILRHQQGRSVEALNMVAAALRTRPGSADALSNYGVILDALNRHEEAVATFDTLLALRSEDATFHYN